MRAGKLRQTIIVQKRLESGDVEYPEMTWIDHCTVRADVQDLSTRDALQAQAIDVKLTARAVVRYSALTAGISYDMRVLFDGVYYQINGTPKRDLGDMRTYVTIELKEGLKEWQTT